MKKKFRHITFKFFHWLFDWLMGHNKECAKIGDEILINCNNLRFPCRYAKVTEVDKVYWESYATRKLVTRREKDLITVQFSPEHTIYNLLPKEYWIVKNNKTKKS